MDPRDKPEDDNHWYWLNESENCRHRWGRAGIGV